MWDRNSNTIFKNIRFISNFYRNNLEENNEKTISKLGVDFINYKSNFEIVK